MSPCRRLLLICSLLALPLAPAMAGEYPERPIRVVIPFPPGAAGDIALRQLQPRLEAVLGQPLVVDYRSGAAGNIGTAAVARAEPDGYTLLLGATNNFAINQFLYPDLGFDPLTSFKPIAKLVEVPTFVYVNDTVPAQDMAQWRRYAQENRGKLHYGSPGTGTTPHLSALMLSRALDADMTHVAYRGTAPGIVGLLGNEVQMYVGGYGVAAAHLASGRVRPLAVTGSTRFALLPDVPTFDELGLPGTVLPNWWGLAAPAGVPDAVATRLADAIETALRDPAVAEGLLKQGFVVPADRPAAFAGALTDEVPRWKAIIETAGVRGGD